MVRNSSDTFFECKTHKFYFFRQQGSFSLLVEARHRQGKDTTFVSSISMVIPRGLARLSTPSLNFRISVLSSYGMHASRPVRLMMSASCRADGVCDNLYENGVLMMTRIKIYLRPTIKGHCGTREVISRIQIYDQRDHFGVLTSPTQSFRASISGPCSLLECNSL